MSSLKDNFNELLKEFDGNYLIKDKEDRLECCQALKRHEREKKVKAVYEKIKRHIKEKYKLCNLYVKNLPDNYDDEAMRKLFEQFGPIKSCKTIKKELVTSYLGIKRSVKVFGYVCFNDKQHAHEAKKALEGKSLSTNGAKLYVDYHQSKAERSEFLKLNMINKSAKNFNKGKMDMMPGPFGMPRGMPQSKFFIIIFFFTLKYSETFPTRNARNGTPHDENYARIRNGNDGKYGRNGQNGYGDDETTTNGRNAYEHDGNGTYGNYGNANDGNGPRHVNE